ncbi:MAG TPA: TonB-dependent receptor, partial [Bacteroidales bacterium]|nr:TonB-dependent receptor [Bacteroidales bacterium]
VLFLVSGKTVYSQQAAVRGDVKDNATGEALLGASVFIEKGNIGTITGKDGVFELELPPGEYTLVASYVGYRTTKIPLSVSRGGDTAIHFRMNRDLIAFSDEVVVVGNRNAPRSVTSSAVPVDQFPAPVLQNSGQTDLSQQLNVLAPSFYSTRMTYSDATDHVDPATLRGMNPDQTLLLVNGKRHHPTAIVNLLSVVGKGSVINDLNTIPSASIRRVEILRDGASAQYGSDAIAGVINLVLKQDTSGLNLQTRLGQTYRGDGLREDISANYGFAIGKGGYVNLTTEFNRRGATNRAGIYNGLIIRGPGQDGLSFEENLALDNQILADRNLTREDFRLHLGNSDLGDGKVFFNTMVPLNNHAEFYAFGGMNYRYSKSAGDYRLPNDSARSNYALYPNGFLPHINARLNDHFISTGIRGTLNGWNADFSNTFGSNGIDYYVSNSANASMGDNSPAHFYSGGTRYAQNTTNLDFSRHFGETLFLHFLDLNFGSEFRVENYRIEPGDEASWINEDQVHYPGAQGFPGFQPVDETDRSRYNIGFYGDMQLGLSRALLVDLAGRFEDYSDFGNNLSGKVAARYKFTFPLSIRGSVSTGFRAPSLHQVYYSNTGSYYFGGNLFEVLTASNISRVARAFGIPPLKEETSVSYSFGLTSHPSSNTTITADVYQVNVDNRIVLSGTFYTFIPEVYALLSSLPTVGGAQFFTNAVNTRTQGLDIVLSHLTPLYSGSLGLSAGINLNRTEVVGDVHASEQIKDNGLENYLFNRQDRALIELAQPLSKYNFTINYTHKKLVVTIRTIRFGQVSYRGIDTSDAELARDQDYSPKWLTDARIDYHFLPSLTFTAGANNIFDIYPDKNNQVLQNYGRFPYNTAVTQFGFNGGFYYAGLELG